MRGWGRWLLVVGLCALLGGCTATGTRYRPQVFDAYPRESRVLVAVLPAVDKTGEQDGVDRAHRLTAQLIDQLSKSGRYRLIERERIDRILQEHSLSMAGITPEQVDMVGSLLGAEALLLTELTGREERERRMTLGFAWIHTREAQAGLAARLVDTKTGEILATAGIVSVHGVRQWVMLWVARIGKMYEQDAILTQALTNGLIELGNQLADAAPRR